MKTDAFILEKGTKKWRYGKFVMFEIEDYRWKMGKDNVFQTYESVYDAIAELSNRFDLHPVFKLPYDVDYVSSKCD